MSYREPGRVVPDKDDGEGLVVVFPEDPATPVTPDADALHVIVEPDAPPDDEVDDPDLGATRWMG